VYATLASVYPRPIGTPIKNLRPAQQTCEQCHWPEHFYGAVEQDHEYFLPDESNTRWRTRLLIHVGGGSDAHGTSRGIHWYMNIHNRIYYTAADDKRETIPWIKSVSTDGKEEVYVADGSGFSASNPPRGEVRLLDCIDCHNRPTHIYRAPAEAVNSAMSAGSIERTLPFIRRQAVEVLVSEYGSLAEAESKIKERLNKFYEDKYPAAVAQNKQLLNARFRR